MTSPERSEMNKGELNRTLDYFKESMELGLVNNFTTDGPVKDEPTVFRDFIFISNPTPAVVSERSVKAFTTGNSSIIEIYDRILKLTLPDRIKNLKIPTISTLKNTNKLRVSLSNMPYIVVALGQVSSTNEEVACMFCITGMSPEEAFADVQDAVRNRKIKFN